MSRIIIPLAFVLLLAFIEPTQADEIDVKAKVAEHGKMRAIAWALEHGYSWAQIREARKCLR